MNNIFGTSPVVGIFGAEPSDMEDLGLDATELKDIHKARALIGHLHAESLRPSSGVTGIRNIPNADTGLNFSVFELPGIKGLTRIEYSLDRGNVCLPIYLAIYGAKTNRDAARAYLEEIGEGR